MQWFTKIDNRMLETNQFYRRLNDSHPNTFILRNLPKCQHSNWLGEKKRDQKRDQKRESLQSSSGATMRFGRKLSIRRLEQQLYLLIQNTLRRLTLWSIRHTASIPHFPMRSTTMAHNRPLGLLKRRRKIRYKHCK